MKRAFKRRVLKKMARRADQQEKRSVERLFNRIRPNWRGMHPHRPRAERPYEFTLKCWPRAFCPEPGIIGTIDLALGTWSLDT